jgi:hypothetical protein
VEAASGEHDGVVFTTDGDSLTLDAIRADYAGLTCWYGDGGSSATSFPVTLALADMVGQPPAFGGGAQGLFLWSVTGTDTVHFQVGGTGPSQLNAGGSLRANGSGILSWTPSIDPPPPYSTQNWSNRLYRNDGGGTFSEVTATAFAVNDSTFNSKAAAWGDYDNDGWTDVYVANGGTVSTGNQPNYLYRNNGDGTFSEVAGPEGVAGATRGMSDGAAWGDVDGDGFLDLFVDNGAEHPPFGVGPRELFMNAPNGNHWISLRLRGLTSNGSGIGARVRFVTASGVQWRTRLGESDNCFSNDQAIHVGLGADTVVDSIQVFWPSGDIRLYEAIPADTKYAAIEGKPIRVAENPHLEVVTADFFDTVELGTVKEYAVQIDNFGGLAADWVARYENCGGQAIDWTSIDPESSTVFPGGTTPLTLTIDTSTLDLGSYCAKTIFESNSFQGPDTLTVFIEVWSPSTGADVAPGIPDRFRLSSPTPNPTRGAVDFVLALPGAGDASVDVYDVGGRHVRSLLAGFQPAGVHPTRWDARDSRGRPVAGGVYFVRARAGAEHEVHKVVILD